MPITVAALRETAAGERRVAITPEMAKKLRGKGLRVLLERDAGRAAGFPDGAYAEVEFADAAGVLAQADVLACVLPPDDTVYSGLREGSVVVGQLRPYGANERIGALTAHKLTAFSLELLPRTTRAQAMDVLSSQAAVAGYRAMLIAAEASPKFFPMLTTAAGTIRPSKVLVIGAGVAGLQAIATARRLGAQTEGYDVRPETREQVESLGAKFLDLGVSAAGSGGYARELSAEETAIRRRFEQITRREAEVLGLLMAGQQVGEIASGRFVSESTVRTQVKSILAKLQVRSQLGAVGLAHRVGWSPPSDDDPADGRPGSPWAVAG